MKKLSIALFVAVMLVAGSVNAQTGSIQDQINALLAQIAALKATTGAAPAASSFTRDLTVGMKGDDVSALQETLIASGDLNVAAPTGFFGAMTKAALIKWQKANGVTPASGYFGSKTRAAMVTVVPPVVVPPTSTSTTTVPPTTSLDNTDGSITISSSGYISSNQTLKKGDTKDVLAARLTASIGKVAINRADVHFDQRPYNLFSKITLKDDKGTVIAEKTLASKADVTEVTVGADYMVRFDNINYVVDPATPVNMVVGLTVLSASDKITGQNVTVSMPAGAIRTINGKGYTDTPSIGTNNAGLSSVVTLSLSGSTATLAARISPSTVPAGIQPVSSTTDTADVAIATFSVKSQNQASTLNKVTVSMPSYTVGTFKNVRLYDGSTQYGAATFAANGLATFTNLSINLAQDTWKDLVVKVDVAATSSVFTAAATLTGAAGTDVNDNDFTATVSVPSNTLTFQVAGVSVSDISVVKGTVLTASNSTTWGVAYPTFSFKLNNTGNDDIYVSATSSVALGTTTAGSVNTGVAASSTMALTAVSPASYSADVAGVAYVVPAGSSRTFTYTATMDNTNGTSGFRRFAINKVKFGATAAVNTTYSVDSGIDALYVQVP